MKIAVNSLNNYLKNKLTTDRVVELLGATEVEVEEIMYSKSWDEQIIVAAVRNVGPHPGADRLRIAEVDTGDEKLQIVCGAPNLAVGQKVVLAQVGAKLPDGTKITASKLRGVMSHGMLCSASELGISDDHSGILVLNPATPVGKSLCDVEQKADILDIKTPANRWDYLSLIGLAREVAAHDEGNIVVIPETPEVTYNKTEVAEVKETGECKRFITVKCRIDNTVKSPQWLVDNLEGNGLRSISPVVDITNFVMIETGQPSHAYDATKLQGRLQVRLASPAENLTTLDGVARKLSVEDLVITDDSGPIGLAGVMGGSTTEVDQATTEILLEVANFDRTRVRKAALRHGLRSEASARFERSLPLPLPIFAAARLVELLTEICHAELIDSPSDQLYGWPWVQQIGLRLRRAEKLLGVKLDERQVMDGFKRLGFEAEHFSMTKEVRKHLGKPYVWGANYKQNGEAGFDCSYLVDRVYSRIGINVGHTALGQFHHGWPVEVGDLRVGDVVFYEGLIRNSVTDYYYETDASGEKHKRTLDKPMKVGHNGIYVGDNTVITAIQYERKGNEWVSRAEQGVVEVPLTDFTNDPTYLGARRYVESFNHIVAITAPWWRTDIRVEEDMVEEAAKIVGYDNIPATIPALPPTNTRPHQLLPRLLELKKTLVAAGLFEVVTYSFIGEDVIRLLGQDATKHLEIARPLSREQQYLRASLLPSHLQMLAANQSYSKAWSAFEVARVHTPAQDGKLPKEEWRLAIVVVGKDSALRLKRLIDVVAQFARRELSTRMADYAEMVPERSADIVLGSTTLGHFGQLRSQILAGFDVTPEASFAEFALEPIYGQTTAIVAHDLVEYQLVRRDISLVCSDAVPWSEINKVILAAPHAQAAEFRNEYTDPQMQANHRKNVVARVKLDLGPNPTSQAIQAATDGIINRLTSTKALGELTIS